MDVEEDVLAGKSLMPGLAATVGAARLAHDGYSIMLAGELLHSAIRQGAPA